MRFSPANRKGCLFPLAIQRMKCYPYTIPLPYVIAKRKKKRYPLVEVEVAQSLAATRNFL